MGSSIFSPWYWLLKLAATFFRGVTYLKRGTERYLRNLPPLAGIARERLQVPSRDKGRFIGVDLYRPADAPATAKLPVIVNWHGSGWLIPSWGEDREFVNQAVKALRCIVLDCNYRKGPEYPYPAAHDDADDVVEWVLSQSERFDIDKVALSGFSAGAAMALSTSNAFSGKIRALSALYPPIDMCKSEMPPKPTRQPRSGVYLAPRVVKLFNDCYVPDLEDRSDPRLVIAGLDTARFPDNIFIATGDIDLLHKNDKEYFEKLAATHKNKTVKFVSVPEEEHGWDKNPLVPESVEARDSVYRQMFDNISQAWGK
ncbi:related to triacylglycerol lipase [Moesziomyces antarcticus]|uniref:Related to triacylglycerol lipase n=1 Tax=Pseudozyma antarctica TaxID=84753 RepID=A0A5C3FDQ6_PSEA2|nr:related to triacylglycerol lipase [Moesziomyces antarcticus]